MGFQITEGWYSTSNKDYYIRDYGQALGGHAVLGAGYWNDGLII